MSYPQPQTYPAPAGEPPLWAPLYGASPVQAVQRFFKKYATFSGRASRSEYWWWALASFIVTIVLELVYVGLGFAGASTDASGRTVPGAGAVIGAILLVVWGLGIIVPGLALAVRRLHDANMSGWFLLIVLVPAVGSLAVLVFMILGPNPAGQRFDRPSGY